MKPIQTTNESGFTRRDFLKVTAGLGLSAGGMTLLEACGVRPTAPTDVLETTTVKIPFAPTICVAPQYLADSLLKSEGFTDVQYVQMPTSQVIKNLAAADIDIALYFGAPSLIQIANGTPITILAGVHVGCFKLFGSDQVRTIADLKGKTVAVTELGGADHVFLSVFAAYVGLDPNKDINWAAHPIPESKQLFTDGQIDGFLAFPPLAQELEDKKIGHVVLDSMMDAPWSGYFCCLATARRDFVQKYPVATKRALRALLQASDICALQPEKAARFVVDKGFTDDYDYALAAMQEIPYNVWREYDPEDTLRFYALRLHEIGMIKSSPEEIIKEGADWTFLNQLKTELKA